MVLKMNTEAETDELAPDFLTSSTALTVVVVCEDKDRIPLAAAKISPIGRKYGLPQPNEDHQFRQVNRILVELQLLLEVALAGYQTVL